jgi:hypothetical protein
MQISMRAWSIVGTPPPPIPQLLVQGAGTGLDAQTKLDSELGGAVTSPLPSSVSADKDVAGVDAEQAPEAGSTGNAVTAG